MCVCVCVCVCSIVSIWELMVGPFLSSTYTIYKFIHTILNTNIYSFKITYILYSVEKIVSNYIIFSQLKI